MNFENLIMKKFVIFVVMAVLSVSVMAQSKSEQRKAEREARKTERAKQETAMAVAVIEAIDARQFVLEADFLSNRYGERMDVSPTLNFIGVDKEFGAFQFGSGSEIGYNGVGGITMEGNIKDFKSKENGSGGYRVEFRVATSGGTIFCVMNVSGTGQADATISSTGGAKLSYSGRLVPLSMSSVYKGLRTL